MVRKLIFSISIFIFAILLTSPGFAETAPAAPPKATVDISSPFSRFKFGTELSVLSGLQSDFGYGFNLGYAYRLGPVIPVYFGMDIGVTRWNANFEKTVGEGDKKQTVPSMADVTSIQVMASLYYRFLDVKTSKAHPFIGISLGPTLISAEDENVKLGDQPISGKSTAVKMQVLFRPGVDIDVIENFAISIEPKIGLLNGSLLFAPQLGFTWSL